MPPALVFDHPGFLLPCCGISVPEDTYVHFYSAYLAHRNDGNWTVLADRTQGPLGAGYALENRIVISRTLPHDFEALHIERLAPVLHRIARKIALTRAGASR